MQVILLKKSHKTRHTPDKNFKQTKQLFYHLEQSTNNTCHFSQNASVVCHFEPNAVR